MKASKNLGGPNSLKKPRLVAGYKKIKYIQKEVSTCSKQAARRKTRTTKNHQVRVMQ